MHAYFDMRLCLQLSSRMLPQMHTALKFKATLKGIPKVPSFAAGSHKVDAPKSSIAEKTANDDSDKERLDSQSDDGFKRWHPEHSSVRVDISTDNPTAVERDH
jgi:hypothetical protein